jgi:hypothetical protein
MRILAFDAALALWPRRRCCGARLRASGSLSVGSYYRLLCVIEPCSRTKPAPTLPVADSGNGSFLHHMVAQPVVSGLSAFLRGAGAVSLVQAVLACFDPQWPNSICLPYVEPVDSLTVPLLTRRRITSAATPFRYQSGSPTAAALALQMAGPAKRDCLIQRDFFWCSQRAAGRRGRHTTRDHEEIG